MNKPCLLDFMEIINADTKIKLEFPKNQLFQAILKYEMDISINHKRRK